jgi:hypothetical protein
MNTLGKGIFALMALVGALSLAGCPASGTDTPGDQPVKPGGPAKSQQTEMERKLNDPNTPESVKEQIRKGLGK